MTEALEITTKSATKDCLSCRIWTGTFHIGVAAYVASHWHKQTRFASKAFVLSFSAGENIIYSIKRVIPLFIIATLYNSLEPNILFI